MIWFFFDKYLIDCQNFELLLLLLFIFFIFMFFYKNHDISFCKTYLVKFVVLPTIFYLDDMHLMGSFFFYLHEVSYGLCDKIEIRFVLNTWRQIPWLYKAYIMVTIFFNLCMSAWENDTAHQLIEQHAETLMHRHSFPTCQKVLDKNLEPQGLIDMAEWVKKFWSDPIDMFKNDPFWPVTRLIHKLEPDLTRPFCHVYQRWVNWDWDVILIKYLHILLYLICYVLYYSLSFFIRLCGA